MRGFVRVGGRADEYWGWINNVGPVLRGTPWRWPWSVNYGAFRGFRQEEGYFRFQGGFGLGWSADETVRGEFGWSLKGLASGSERHGGGHRRDTRRGGQWQTTKLPRC